jgi:putative tricarboxylic transport membrane protein
VKWTSAERSGELVIAGILFCIGLFWIIESLLMPFGEYSVPGPGFFPIWLGVLLCIVSVTLGVQRFLDRDSVQVKIGDPKIWFTIIAVIVLAVFFERLGFILMITLFVAFFMNILSHSRWYACILWGIAAAISAYLFFDLLLGIQLPRGRWILPF